MNKERPKTPIRWPFLGPKTAITELSFFTLVALWISFSLSFGVAHSDLRFESYACFRERMQNRKLGIWNWHNPFGSAIRIGIRQTRPASHQILTRARLALDTPVRIGWGTEPTLFDLLLHFRIDLFLWHHFLLFSWITFHMALHELERLERLSPILPLSHHVLSRCWIGDTCHSSGSP